MEESDLCLFWFSAGERFVFVFIAYRFLSLEVILFEACWTLNVDTSSNQNLNFGSQRCASLAHSSRDIFLVGRREILMEGIYFKIQMRGFKGL